MQKMSGKWLCAVSGGSDSMALLAMCIEDGVDCAVAHVNYHHRQQADIEEEYVKNFCKEHHIDCYVRNEPFVVEGNFEACARQWRYDFFVQLVKQYHFKGVLIAHQEDDLIETYLMQEERDLVPAYYGLKEENMYEGILVKRPLLHQTKKELEEYCHNHQILYYTDITNEDTTYARNRMRHEMVEPMNRFTRDMVLAEIQKKNAQRQERTCRVGTYIHEGKVSLAQYRLLEEADRLSLLRQVIEPDEQTKEAKVSLSFSKEMDHILMSQNDFEVPVHQLFLVQSHGYFFMSSGYSKYRYVLSNLEELLKLGEKDCFAVRKGQKGVYAVTLKESDYPLILRNYEEGDRIELRFGTKKIARFFVDRKIPRYLRSSWPILCNSSNKVIFVPLIGCDYMHFTDTPSVNVVQYPLIKETF